jgi:small subunit ribosomal protein S30e
LLLRLVHGSLARAGKVKSQTPKVEPQEKKKSPKGRAKKRMVYNRRYGAPLITLFIRLISAL